MASADKKKRNPLISYFEASYEEIRKVAWPTRNRAIRLTFLVLGFVVAVALVIGLLDFVFGAGHRALLDLAPDRAIPTVETTQPVDVTTTQPTETDVPDNALDVGDISISTGDEQPVEADAASANEEPAMETPAENSDTSTATPTEETPS